MWSNRDGGVVNYQNFVISLMGIAFIILILIIICNKITITITKVVNTILIYNAPSHPQKLQPLKIELVMMPMYR
jgi:hypothetical protein